MITVAKIYLGARYSCHKAAFLTLQYCHSICECLLCSKILEQSGAFLPTYLLIDLLTYLLT